MQQEEPDAESQQPIAEVQQSEGRMAGMFLSQEHTSVSYKPDVGADTWVDEKRRRYGTGNPEKRAQPTAVEAAGVLFIQVGKASGRVFFYPPGISFTGRLRVQEEIDLSAG